MRARFRPTRFATLTILAAATAAAAACESAESKTDDVDADKVPQLALVEEVRIGSLDDPELGFSRVGGVDVDAEGLTYVLESQENEIRVFDRDGHRVRTIGRQGSGPGEFESSSRFGIIGDTVWVIDERLSRLTLFSLEGDVVSTAEAVGVEIDAGGLRAWLFPYRLRPDRLMEGMITRMASGPNPTRENIISPRLLFDLDGNVVDTLAIDTMPSPFTSRPERITVGSITFSKPSPPNDQPWPITTDDGRILVDRWHAPTGDPSTFTVTRFDTAGDTLYRRTFRYAPKPYDGAPFDSLVAARARLYKERAGADFNAVRAAIRDAWEMPPYQSPVQSTHLGTDESVWLRREDTGGDYTWMLLAPDGSARGQLTLPRRATISWSNGEEAWVVVRDKYDVQWLVRYAITDPGSNRNP